MAKFVFVIWNYTLAEKRLTFYINTLVLFGFQILNIVSVFRALKNAVLENKKIIDFLPQIGFGFTRKNEFRFGFSNYRTALEYIKLK